MSSLLIETAIRGYHVYRVLWEPYVEETLIVLHGSGNNHDRHAMAVYRDEAASELRLNFGVRSEQFLVSV